MATLTDRLWESGGKMRSAYQVWWVSREGKRRTATFHDQAAAEFFLAEITKREDRWRAERLLKEIDGAAHG